MNGFWESVTENIIFVLEFLGVVAAVFIVAFIAELAIRKKNNVTEKILSTRKMAVIGAMSAISGILMTFEFTLPFVAPDFYRLDFSELPVLITGMAFGPVAGVVAEFLKVLIKLLIKGTSTAFVGDLANFVIGCALILPATLIYHIRKRKLTAIIGCIVGAICMIVFGTYFNAVYLLPKFSEMYGMPMDALVQSGTDIHSSINNVTTFVIMIVAPLNLIKSSIVSIITIAIYQPLRPILKGQNK